MPKSNSFGVSNGEYWFELTVNKSLKNKELIAYLPVHNIGEIGIYKFVDTKLEYLVSTGNNIGREEIPVDYKFPAFKINPEENRIFYLKVNFQKEANFPLKIISEKKFTSYISNKQVINSFYYGTCIVIIFLNFFFYLKLKDNSYLFYMLFLLSLMITFLLYDGSLINLFRGNSFYYKLEFLTHFSNEIWFLLFSIKFLDLNKRHPLITRLFFVFPALVLVFYILYFSTNNFVFSAIGDFIGISLFPILWFFGFYYLKQIPHARFYVLGYLLIVPFAVFFIIGFPFGFWEVHGEMLIIKIASWLDIFVFTYALSFKMDNSELEGNKKIISLQDHIENPETELPLKNEPQPKETYFYLLRENKLVINPLTLREIDILKAIFEGLNNTQVSEKLFISKNTVKYHVRNIYNKLNVSNRNELKEKASLLKKQQSTQKQILKVGG
ncbi:LuxR C-terminal-related transcriptional regulator [Polaribacter sp. SA4-12]|uniref:LuxR C-terminal-related transcriptional regulator n=1 Tax=Polaribacter sp. SA4-12 TaxID=1312072 RepID=UPI0012FA8409|nr:LuxR C-terminal-related transcriptional regulator [Polaribacter sp. SA4-12]